LKVLYICDFCECSYPDKEEAQACEEACGKNHEKWLADYEAKKKREAEEDAKELCPRCKYRVTDYYRDIYKICQNCEKFSNFEEG
jgi:hypothetical protein